MIFLTIISVLAVRVHCAPTVEVKSNRSSKFMRFGSADDLFSDVLEEMHDPILTAKDMSMENVSDRLKGSAHNSNPTAYPFSLKNTSGHNPIKTEEKIALYNQNTGKYELITSTSGHFMLPAKPATESGVFFYGGQHYQYRKPEEDAGNKTGEIKIFWTSVTDAIQNLPFIPVQVNVPDMISAMANFLSTSIPIINRFTNPNNPRLPLVKPETIDVSTQHDAYKSYHNNVIYDNNVEDRELKNDINIRRRKPNKQQKTQRRKNSNSKRKNEKGSTKGLVPRPFKRTTEVPTEDKKAWFAAGESSGTTLKNMPITRQKFMVRDREVFNFKNSDISNSPIMILNLPERPMMYYKTNIRQKTGENKSEKPDSKPGNIWQNSPVTPMAKTETRANSKKTAPKRIRNPPKQKEVSSNKNKS